MARHTRPATRPHRRIGCIVPCVLIVGLAGFPMPASGQADTLRADLQESRRRLEEIQEERRRLQTELLNVQSRQRDVALELANIERQLSASRSAAAEIDFQLEAMSIQLSETTQRLAETREQLGGRRDILNERLRGIYKRGALSTPRVLLGAESFANLINRYRYLRLLATVDRSIVDRVQQLEAALVSQTAEMRAQETELERLRRQRLSEVAELQRLESSHRSTLETFRAREERTTGELDRLGEAEVRLTSLVVSLERRRMDAEARDEPVDGSLTGADAGALDWPVDGEVIYSFGRQRQPNGTVLRWNGIGIAAPVGTPVRAVRPGQVVLAGTFQGYGPIVVISHGDGFYTLYLYLDEIHVTDGRTVEAGAVIGTVGGVNTPEGPHLEFQVRAPVNGGVPQALDPLQWLKPAG